MSRNNAFSGFPVLCSVMIGRVSIALGGHYFPEYFVGAEPASCLLRQSHHHLKWPKQLTEALPCEESFLYAIDAQKVGLTGNRLPGSGTVFKIINFTTFCKAARPWLSPELTLGRPMNLPTHILIIEGSSESAWVSGSKHIFRYVVREHTTSTDHGSRSGT